MSLRSRDVIKLIEKITKFVRVQKLIYQYIKNSTKSQKGFSFTL